MNILIINPMIYTAPLKGAPIPRRESISDAMICNLCMGFINNGHKVTLIASEEYKPLKDERFDFDIIYLKNSIAKYIPKFPHGLPVLKGLRRYLIENHSKYDIVISSELFTFHSVTAARVCPGKLIIWQEFGHHHRIFHKIPSRIWHNTIVRFFIKKKVIIVPRSTVAQRFARQYCDIVSDEIINNSIDTNIFKYNENKEDYLIVVSRLVPGKNIKYILEQYIKYIKKSNSQMRLYIVGDGPEREILEQYTKTENISNRIIFLGSLEHRQFADLLSKAKGFMCCTKQELNMISITEALACGTPILTNCIPQQHEMITDHNLGIAKDNWDENDIAKLITNNKTYINNCKSVAESLSNNIIAQLIITIFNKYRYNATNPSR